MSLLRRITMSKSRARLHADALHCARSHPLHPAIFSSLLTSLGVTGLEVSELYSLDVSLLESLQPVYALVFLFKYVDAATIAQAPDNASTGRPASEDETAGFYFAHQVINNACATLAILNAVLNVNVGAGSPAQPQGDSNEVKLGGELDTLREFSMALDPTSRGWVIGQSERIREGPSSGALPGITDAHELTSYSDATST